MLVLNDTLRLAQVQMVVDALNAGTGPARMRLYLAPQPATGGAVTTLFCDMAMSDPVELSLAPGIITLGMIQEGTVLPAGSSSPAWGRLVDSDETFIADFTVSDCSPLYPIYGVSTLSGLFAHFAVTTLADLLAVLSNEDRDRLGDLIIPALTFLQGDFLRLSGVSIRVA